MDDRYGGRISRQKMRLNDFYDQCNKNIYVFGGSNLQYRLKLLEKHIEKMYYNNEPTIVFFSASNNSFTHREITNTILYTKKRLHDTQNQLILIDQDYPYYHPLLGVGFNDIVRVVDSNDDLLRDDSAYLDGVLTIMKAEKIPLKLHSIMEYTNLSLRVLIDKCNDLIGKVNSTALRQDLIEAKEMFEEDQLTKMSAAPVRKLLKKLNFSISDLNNKYCHYSISNAVKQNKIICINLANGAKELMEYFQAELSYISNSYTVILFDVNCTLCDKFENKMIDIAKLSIYSNNFNRDFSSLKHDAILGKNNITLLFKMQPGSAFTIVDYYGKHDYVYKLDGRGHGHSRLDIFHLRDTYYSNSQTHRERINKLSGENVADLLENFECFEIRDNDIIYHNNVSYEGL